MDAKERKIREYAKEFKLSAFSEYKDALRECGTGATFEDVLLTIMATEHENRTENRNRRMLRQAGFPFLKTLEEFDYGLLNKNVSPMYVNELATCDFIRKNENIVMIGNPGRGKTHLSIALGIKACNAGYRVLFKNTYGLAVELKEAADSLTLNRLEKSVVSADLLILDEMSYFRLDKVQSELIFKVISERDEKGSIIITTNLPISRWTELFESPSVVPALADRLAFKSHIMDMNGESYRLMDSKRKAAERNGNSLSADDGETPGEDDG